MSNSKWKVGDVVCLKCGGPQMTVNALEEEEYVSCVWIENSRLCEADMVSGDALCAEPTETFVGDYFLSLKGDGTIEWQGQVLAALPGHDLYQVELFSWIHGEAVERRIISIHQMEAWRFYENLEQMQNAYKLLKNSGMAS